MGFSAHGHDFPCSVEAREAFDQIGVLRKVSGTLDVIRRSQGPMMKTRKILVLLLLGLGGMGPLCHARPAVASKPPEAQLERWRNMMKHSQAEAVEREVRVLLAQITSRNGGATLEAAQLTDVLVEALSSGVARQNSETLALARQAVAIKEQQLGPEDPEVARSLFNLANVLGWRGEFVASESTFVRSLEIREKALGQAHPDVAETLDGYAGLLLALGDYAKGKQLHARALAIREKTFGPNHPDTALSMNNLACAYGSLGEFAEARRLFERSLSVREKLLGPNHKDTAQSLNNLGWLLEEMGDFAEAEPYYRRAGAIWNPTGATAGLGEANLATVHLKMGDLDGAREYGEKALAGYEQAQDLRAVIVRNFLGDVSAAEGDFKKARSAYERVLRWREENLGPDHPEVADTLSGLAGTFSHQVDYVAARPLYERALSIREKAVGPRHPLVGATWTRLGEVELRSGDFAAALEASLRAEEIGREHVRLTSHTLPERQALRYAAVRASGLDLALSLIAKGSTPDTRRRTWDALVRSRALVLDEMAIRRRSFGALEDPAVNQLVGKLASSSQRLANLTIRGPGDTPPDLYRKLLDDSRLEKETAERALAEKSAPFRKEQARGRMGLEEVAAALAPGDALVAFARYDRYQPAADLTGTGASPSKPVPAYIAFVMRGGSSGASVWPLGSAQEIEALVRGWRTEVTHTPPDAQQSKQPGEASYRLAGEALRRRIWDPFADTLKGARRLFVVPDGTLNLVNLSALPARQGGYLIEKGPPIHYLSAERDLVIAGPPARKGEGLLAVGGPAFGEVARILEPYGGASAGSPQGAVPPFRGSRSGCGDFQSMSFEGLPGSQSEAEEVAALWKARRGTGSEAASSVDHLTGAGASEAAFKAKAPGHRVLHLATHGFFLGGNCKSALEGARGIGGLKSPSVNEPPPIVGENPLLLSGLALAGANLRNAAGLDQEDGILTAEEIAAMNFSGVEWAVLSACDTGIGEIQSGEGVLGLRRAFQIAGASTVIMSLWAVEDESAREWMKALYTARLVGNASTMEAVRDASLGVLRSRQARSDSTHPFYWAGFVAAGDWR